MSPAKTRFNHWRKRKSLFLYHSLMTFYNRWSRGPFELPAYAATRNSDGARRHFCRIPESTSCGSKSSPLTTNWTVVPSRIVRIIFAYFWEKAQKPRAKILVRMSRKLHESRARKWSDCVQLLDPVQPWLSLVNIIITVLRICLAWTKPYYDSSISVPSPRRVVCNMAMGR